VTVSSTRTWSVTSQLLTAGLHTIVVSATNAAGITSTMQQRLTVAPLAPVVAIDGGSSRLTNNPNPQISGTTNVAAGSPVTVTVGAQSFTTTVTSSGTWSVAASALPSAVYAVLATVRGSAGTTSTARLTLTVDTIAPAIVINGGSVMATESTTPLISGRTDMPAGSSMSVAVDGVSRLVTVSSTRTWSITSQLLTLGAHTVVVSATDAAGNKVTMQQRLTVGPVAPVVAIDGGSSRLTNNPNPQISGTTNVAAGSPVRVTVGAQTFTTTVTSSGTWSVAASALPSAVYSVLATVRGSAGTTSTARLTLTVDTIAPAIVINGGSVMGTESTTPLITGRGDMPAGSSVKVIVDGVAQVVTVSSTQTWSVTSQLLTAGAHTVIVSATDAAGNTGTMQQRLSVASIRLGTSARFSVLAAAAVTLPGSTLPGEVGSGAAITDDAGTMYGSVRHGVNDSATIAALADARAAYTSLAAMAPTGTLAGDDLGGQRVYPGVYHRVAAYAVTTPVTFDAQGNPDATFVMRSDAALNTTAATRMVLLNGAKASNIYWVLGGAATLGASSWFSGTILSAAAITVGAGSHVDGRALSVTAAVTLDANVFSTIEKPATITAQ